MWRGEVSKDLPGGTNCESGDIGGRFDARRFDAQRAIRGMAMISDRPASPWNLQRQPGATCVQAFFCCPAVRLFVF